MEAAGGRGEALVMREGLAELDAAEDPEPEGTEDGERVDSEGVGAANSGCVGSEGAEPRLGRLRGRKGGDRPAAEGEAYSEAGGAIARARGDSSPAAARTDACEAAMAAGCWMECGHIMA